MKSFLSGFDANGTDGTDPAKVDSIYRVIDDNGFEYTIRVPTSEPDPDSVLKQKFVELLDKSIVTDHGKDADVKIEVTP